MKMNDKLIRKPKLNPQERKHNQKVACRNWRARKKKEGLVHVSGWVHRRIAKDAKKMLIEMQAAFEEGMVMQKSASEA